MKQLHITSLALFVSAAAVAVLAQGSLPQQARGADGAAKIPTIAVIATEWRENSHADVIAGRLVEGYTLSGKGEFPQLKVVSAFTDQVPKNDKSRQLAQQHGFKIFDSIEGALTLGSGKLAVDGVLIIAEHGDYPESPSGQFIFPKRRFWHEVVKVFETSGRVVPVFSDKHIADNWQDAKWIYDATQRLKIPFMAGSSLPVLWRHPPADVQQDAALREILITSYHRLDSYGFHAVEALQCLAERRRGGETGIKHVRCLEGAAVWEAADRGEFDMKLLAAASARFRSHPIPAGKTLRDDVKQPSLMQFTYADGLKASVLTLDGIYSDWGAAWKYEDGRIDTTLFQVQEERPFMHFAYLVKGIEQMMHSSQPAWPAERTLLTSGALDAALISRSEKGRLVETPYLNIAYKTSWKWQQPPEFPPK